MVLGVAGRRSTAAAPAGRQRIVHGTARHRKPPLVDPVIPHRTDPGAHGPAGRPNWRDHVPRSTAVCGVLVQLVVAVPVRELARRRFHGLEQCAGGGGHCFRSDDRRSPVELSDPADRSASLCADRSWDGGSPGGGSGDRDRPPSTRSDQSLRICVRSDLPAVTARRFRCPFTRRMGDSRSAHSAENRPSGQTPYVTPPQSGARKACS